MFASVYRECVKLGMTPAQVDELEMWEIAVVLGADLIVREDDPHALLRARVAHAQGQGPKPEAPAMSQEEFNELTNVLGMSSV